MNHCVSEWRHLQPPTLTFNSRSSEKHVSLPAEVDEVPIPTSVKMALLRDGKPVTTVALGEELELRWWFTVLGGGVEGKQPNKTGGVKPEKGGKASLHNPHKGKLGFFVDSCVAEVS